MNYYFICIKKSGIHLAHYKYFLILMYFEVEMVAINVMEGKDLNWLQQFCCTIRNGNFYYVDYIFLHNFFFLSWKKIFNEIIWWDSHSFPIYGIVFSISINITSNYQLTLILASQRERGTNNNDWERKRERERERNTMIMEREREEQTMIMGRPKRINPSQTSTKSDDCNQLTDMI